MVDITVSEADDELYVAYVNSNNAATTAGFYSGFTVPPTVELDARAKNLGIMSK